MRADRRLLDALRETQIEQGDRLVGLDGRIGSGAAEMRRGSATLQVGMNQIGTLLERDTGE